MKALHFLRLERKLQVIIYESAALLSRLERKLQVIIYESAALFQDWEEKYK